MTKEEILKQANLDDVSVEMLEQYIKQRKSKEGLSQAHKLATNAIHTLFCKDHEDSVRIPCHYYEEENQENTWAKMEHRNWIRFTTVLFDKCELEIDELSVRSIIGELTYIVGRIENVVNKESLSKLVKAWIDYNYKS